MGAIKSFGNIIKSFEYTKSQNEHAEVTLTEYAELSEPIVIGYRVVMSNWNGDEVWDFPVDGSQAGNPEYVEEVKRNASEQFRDIVNCYL